MAEKNTAVERTPESKEPQILTSESLADRVNLMCDRITRRAYEIFDGNGHRLGHDVEDWFQAEAELLRPVSLDLTETENALELKAEVPGFTEKDLEVSVEPQRLTISGKHEASKEEKKGKTLYSETSSSDILRVITLPAEVDAAKASATLKDGILNLTLPKAAKAQTIQVKSAGA
jgi:HSP20 family protein